VILAIENHDRFTTAQFIELLRRVDSPCARICLDTVNSFGAMEGPGTVLDALLPFTVNLHVKDFVVRRRSHQMGFEIEGAPAGQGRLNIPDILRRLEVFQPAASAVLELWTPPAPTIEETVAREQTWALQSVAYLREVLAATSRSRQT